MNEKAQIESSLRWIAVIRDGYVRAEAAVRAAAADTADAQLVFKAIRLLCRTDWHARNVYKSHVARFPENKNDFFESVVRHDLRVELPPPWLIDVTYAGYRKTFGSRIAPILDVWECQLLDRLLAKPGRDT